MTVDEETDEAIGVFFENVFSACRKPFVLNGVIVEGFGLLFDEAKSKTGANAGVTFFFVLEFEDFEDRAGVVVHAASVSVILPHEHFDPTEDCFLRVAKFIGDYALKS